MPDRAGVSRRLLRTASTVLLLTVPVTACSWRQSTSECQGGDGDRVVLDSRANEPADAARPTPVEEALWAADRSGWLRAYDGRTNRVTASIEIGRSTVPPMLLAADGLIWVYRYDDGQLTLVDPVRPRAVKQRITVPAAQPLARNRFYHAHDALWIAQPGRLWRVERSGKASSVPLPDDAAPTGVTTTDDWLWLAVGRRLVRVDPRTLAVTVGVELPAAVRQLSGAGDRLLGLGVNRSEIWVLDPRTGALESSITIPDGELVGSVFHEGDEIWATGNCGHVIRVTDAEPYQVRLTRISDVSQDFGLAVMDGSLWIADEDRSELVRIDLGSDKVLARLTVPAADPDDPLFGLVAGRQSVWLLDNTLAGRVLRVDPASNRVLRLSPFQSLDGLFSAVVAAPPDRPAPPPAIVG